MTFSWWYLNTRDVAGALVYSGFTCLSCFAGETSVGLGWAPAPLTEAVLTGTNSLIWTPS